MVTWEDIAAIDQNGIINYEVQFEPLQLTDELMTDIISTTDLSVNITGLEEYVEYNISVRAFTSVGPGPYSDPVTERTLEDGMYFTLYFPCGIIVYITIICFLQNQQQLLKMSKQQPFLPLESW